MVRIIPGKEVPKFKYEEKSFSGSSLSPTSKLQEPKYGEANHFGHIDYLHKLLHNMCLPAYPAY